MQKPDIYRLLEFQRLLQQFQAIERVSEVPGEVPGSPGPYRRENDTEHSYNLTMTSWYLSGHFAHLDRDKVIRLALVHDLVEVYAGDTYFHADQAALKSKLGREAAALKRLRKDWEDFPDMAETIHQYELRSSKEAKFVYALDKVMPIMLLYLVGGNNTWKQEGITHKRLHEAKRHKVAASKEINEYYWQLHQLLLENPQLFPENSEETGLGKVSGT